MRLLELGLTWPLDTYLVSKFEGLAARGFEVTVEVSGDPGGDHVQPYGVNVVRQRHWSQEPLERRLQRLAGLEPDVIHFEWNSAAIQYLRLRPNWNVPIVISCHGSEVMVRPHRRDGAGFAGALKQSFQAATAVHCVSEAVASAAYELGLWPGKTWVIRPGVDTDAFAPAARPSADPGPLRVITIGTLRALKGHTHALQAFRALLDSGIQATLDLIGGDPAPALAEGSQRRQIEQEVDRLRLGAHVQLRGALSPEEVRDALQASDVLLHMSLSEGLSVAMLEAMACGLPVVVTAAGGAAEAVSHGVEGFVVSLRDSGAAARALRTLAVDAALRRSMGEAGRRAVERRFTLRRLLDEFEELYRHVGLFAGPPRTAAPRSVLSP